jgi:hypothetical protein
MLTNKSQRNRIEMQLISYKRFLKICDMQSITKLCKEIIKLENRLELLRQMSDNELKKEVQFQYLIVQSKANKL